MVSAEELDHFAGEDVPETDGLVVAAGDESEGVW